MQEVGISSCRREPDLDGKGRFGFVILEQSGMEFEILMPGIPLEHIRNVDLSVAPRMYVNGSSWWWEFAVNIIKSDMEEASVINE